MYSRDFLTASLADLREELARLRTAGVDFSLQLVTFGTTADAIRTLTSSADRAWVDERLLGLRDEFDLLPPPSISSRPV